MLFPAAALPMDYQAATQRAGYELVECAAYYLSASVALEKEGKNKEADQFERLSSYALDLARIDLTVNALSRKLAEAQAANAETMKNGGLAKLFERYANSCKTVLEKPGERLDYWRQQEE